MEVLVWGQFLEVLKVEMWSLSFYKNIDINSSVKTCALFDL